MISWRRLLVWLTNFVLGLDLYLLAIIISLLFTIGSAIYIKSLLVDSGFYNNFTTSTMKLASAQALDQPDSSSNQKIINDLAPVFNKVISPTFLRTNIELVIDGLNGWLGGQYAEPTFMIDLHQLKTDLKTQVAIYLQSKVQALPLCQSYADYNNYDPVNAICRPPVSLSNANYQLAADNFISTVPLLDKQVITFNSLGTQPNGQKKPAWQKLPIYDKWFRLSPWFFSIIAILGATCILLLSRNKAHGLKIIGHAFVWSGGILLVSGALALLFIGRDSTGFVGNGTAQQIAFAKELFVPIAQHLVRSFGNFMLYFGAGYAIVGGGCYFIAHRLKLKELRVSTSKPTS